MVEIQENGKVGKHAGTQDAAALKTYPMRSSAEIADVGLRNPALLFEALDTTTPPDD